ncbi:tetratricopeptide repeat protein [Dethiosulfatarculus sandiegensis]|uniref:Uncharacterized protein n=1 Tax=Dethiosulfatarculus sandiegensis TaxID=1429043 RepID=A0A0D2JBF6_9BACT|nr:tetratricopeptide repeat protein [Dethiosulfatarculus sandiegensis]KIX13066.1 hypothetical protein X474_15995 [Dethiosulfatarculus sandiegensis]
MVDLVADMEAEVVELIPESERQEALKFLWDSKERDQLIEAFLREEMGLEGYKAKLVAKILIPSLGKLVGGVAKRSAKHLHQSLEAYSSKYEKIAQHISIWLAYRFRPTMAKDKALKNLTQKPQDIDEKDWARFSEQNKVWITELAQLEQISLALGDLGAEVTLDIDKPKELAGRPPSFWLHPYNDFIPLKGRDKELESLGELAESSDPFLWTFLTGDGGIGKTRLAHEFAKSREQAGWHAGFLRAESLESLVSNPGFKKWRPFVDTFLIVDYAAQKTEPLKKLLLRCVRLADADGQEEEPVRVRLLLLERQGAMDDGWLKTLLSAGEGAQKQDLQFSLVLPRELYAPVNDSADETLQDILSLSFKRWQEITGKTPPPIPGFDDDSRAHFREATQMRPLFVQMAAIHACETGDALGLHHWTMDDLIKNAVEREREFIRKIHPDASFRICLERAVALLNFTGPQPVDSSEWMNLLEQDAKDCGYPNIQPGELCEAMKSLLGQEAGGISPMQPDILAAAFSVTILQERPAHIQELLARIVALSGTEAWGRLLRAVVDLYYLEKLDVIEDWLLEFVPGRSAEELYAVEKLAGKASVAYRKILAVLYKALLRLIKQEEEALPERGRIFNNLGYSYDALGRREEAFEASLSAVEIYERLTVKHPDSFEPDLASSLNNLGNRYSALGRREEALEASLSAVDIYERLAVKHPEAFEPDLARSLNNLGNRYSALGRREEALEASLSAVDIYDRLAVKHPDSFEPDLAGSLNNLGMDYSALGLHEAALEASQRAVDIYDRLAVKHPDSFEPDLAMSLNNLGMDYSALGLHEAALEANLSAVEIYERLAQKHPDAFEPDLALSLNNLGHCYNALGRHEAALEASQRAVEIRERLAVKHPEAFEPDLGKSLNNLGNDYSALGLHEAALEASQRAVDIYERLAVKHPEAFEPDLGKSLNNLGNDYSALGRREEALEASLRAVEIRERLAVKHPDAFEPDLALSCGARGNALKEAGQDGKAIESFLLGITKLERLFLLNPQLHGQLMAALIGDYNNAYQAAGIEPDQKTLSPIIEVLEDLKQEQNP